MRKVEYDFLIWTSFPSSLNLYGNEPGRLAVGPFLPVEVKAGKREFELVV